METTMKQLRELMTSLPADTPDDQKVNIDSLSDNIIDFSEEISADFLADEIIRQVCPRRDHIEKYAQTMYKDENLMPAMVHDITSTILNSGMVKWTMSDFRSVVGDAVNRYSENIYNCFGLDFNKVYGYLMESAGDSFEPLLRYNPDLTADMVGKMQENLLHYTPPVAPHLIADMADIIIMINSEKLENTRKAMENDIYHKPLTLKHRFDFSKDLTYICRINDGATPEMTEDEARELTEERADEFSAYTSLAAFAKKYFTSPGLSGCTFNYPPITLSPLDKDTEYLDYVMHTEPEEDGRGYHYSEWYEDSNGNKTETTFEASHIPYDSLATGKFHSGLEDNLPSRTRSFVNGKLNYDFMFNVAGEENGEYPPELMGTGLLDHIVCQSNADGKPEYVHVTLTPEEYEALLSRVHDRGTKSISEDDPAL